MARPALTAQGSTNSYDGERKSSGWVPCPSSAQPGAGMLALGMAALRLAMAPEKQAASKHYVDGESAGSGEPPSRPLIGSMRTT